MKKKIRVLLLENDPEDADLVQKELNKTKFPFVFRRAEDEEGFRGALKEFLPDLILSEYCLPSFEGASPLDIAKEIAPEIPFIFISKQQGEDRAIESIKAGATDYVLKSGLSRLNFCVTRALREREAAEEQKQLRSELVKTLEQEGLILQGLPLALYSVSGEAADRRISWVSEQVIRIFGYSAICFSDDPLFWTERLHPDDVERVWEEFRKIHESGHSVVEYRWRCADGNYRWFLDEAVLMSSSGRPGEILGMWLDVTERKKLEQDFFRAQKMEAIGRLAGGVAHDFNNMLTVILGYSDFLQEQLKEESLRADLAEIKKAGERASSLTRQLLAFSRRQRLQPEVVNLNAVISDLARMLRRLIGEDIELVLTLDPGLRRVKLDPGQLEQAILNLVVNARDAMPQGGRIEIATRNLLLKETFVCADGTSISPGRYARLDVSDTGCGMEPSVKEKIFEPFFTTKDETRGTGLGLSTVYGLVKQSNGCVYVHSEPGRGSAFQLFFPTMETESPVLEKKPERSGRVAGEGTILVVEDEESVRRLILSTLKQAGYETLSAGNGTDALEVAARHEGRIHLVLSDVVMPHMSGRALTERLRQFCPDFKVLYMSGYNEETIQNCGIAGPDGNVLQKPFTPDALVRKIREILEEDKVSPSVPG